MKLLVASCSFLLLFAVASSSQTSDQKPIVGTTSKAAAREPASALDIANAAVAAHGGDDLKRMTSFVVRGSVDVTGAFSYVIPATFMMVIAGERYAFELKNPFQPLRQVFDGTTTHSSGYELPPITSLGFPLLTRIGADGYVVSDIGGDKKKKRTGFRITTPDGFYTDFVVDTKTGRVKGYESSYDIDGRIVTTSVAIDEFETVKGVSIPKRFSQRFDLGQMTVYANFKSKETLVNTEIDDSVFAIAK